MYKILIKRSDMKTLQVICLMLALLLSGCSTVNKGKTVARVVSNTSALSQQIDGLQDELSPYIHNQQSLKDLDLLQQDVKSMMLGDTSVGTVRELVDRYLTIKEALTNEANSRVDEMSEIQLTQLKALKEELDSNEDDIMELINNETVDKIEVARYLYEFGKVGFTLYKEFK